MAKRGPKGPSKYTPEFIEKLADNLIGWMKIEGNFWLGKFCTDNRLWLQRLDEFADSNDKFSETLKEAKQWQMNKLVMLASKKEIDTTMAIFALKNVAGWRDKQEIEHSGELKGTNINITAINTGSNGNRRELPNNAEANRSSAIPNGQ